MLLQHERCPGNQVGALPRARVIHHVQH
uniref:Uncharacterized protein n=1 Tax=Arundo donax TaxID=35708 RepID=A0A0A9C901_ARUDO